MPDLPISGLTPATSLLAGDEYGINQGLNSRKVNYQQLLALPNIDVLISGTPFSTATIGRVLNATAAVTMTTKTAVEADQLAIEAGTMWPIEATGGIVTVAEGVGVTLEFYDGSSITTGPKAVSIGATAVLRKISDTVYRIMTNETPAAGGGSPGLEIIQNIGETLPAGGLFTSTAFDIAAGDVIVYEIMADKDNGDQVSLGFDVTNITIPNLQMDSNTQLADNVYLKGMLTVQANGTPQLSVRANYVRTVTVTEDFNSGVGTAIVGTVSVNITIDEQIFCDDYRMKGYIARVL